MPVAPAAFIEKISDGNAACFGFLEAECLSIFSGSRVYNDGNACLHNSR